MSTRGLYSWQTSLADLSLILFMVTAAAVGRSDPPRKAEAVVASKAESVRSDPLAVYRVSPEAPPLSRWLAEQAGDPRQQLTITARYGPEQGAQARALSEAMRLLEEARDDKGGLLRRVRIVVEPGEGAVEAALGFDMPVAGARGQPPAQTPPQVPAQFQARPLARPLLKHGVPVPS